MSDHIAIDHDLMLTQASQVERVAADIAVARDATRSTNMGGGAFGVLCGFLVTPATVVATIAGSAIGSAEGMVRRSASELRGVSNDMTRFETDLLQSIAQLESPLD
ncbi:hypothetical protein LK09_13145 [Microbacterium mangrovi]|uniref:Uncharacterized protein n=1 Tax=Microbacterium mangrovi TaxID=1348253 RepID=A0A0B2A2D8_9MICO|nr:hypothetical protein [Microbacterium mangrovi]KHK97196.1 hypothetical protein LK09_13145 [Microbacterium mangrovi]